MIQFIIENEQDKLEFTDELETVIQQAVSVTLDTIGGKDTDFEVSILITDDEGKDIKIQGQANVNQYLYDNEWLLEEITRIINSKL